MTKHHIGVIGGSGLYAMEGLTDVREQYVRTPFGDASDQVVMGTLGDTRFYFMPRHGRGHLIPPHRINYRANIYALKLVGAQQLVSISAVGSLQEHMRPGDLVAVDQYIDRTKSRTDTFFEDDGLVAHVSLADPTDPALSDCLAQAGERAGARVHRGGTYVCMEGPQFSTRAESMLYRSWGAHVIGMTNLPEARLAREAELPYASLALVTDFDCWHEEEADVSVAHVVEVMQRNVATARRILASIEAWPDPSTSPASNALAHALITDRNRVSPQAREKLSLLVSRYLPVEGA
ncbi:MAG: S-methyl-5'-thioadenosine phosphorylase [Myxococcales bacterium]